MIVRIHNTLRCAAIFFMLLGATFIIALLADPAANQSYWLEAAVCAAGVSIIALLLGVLVRRLDAEQRFGCMLLPIAETNDEGAEYGAEWAKIAHRRELLDKRLQIDKPRLCSKRNFLCTCWSFCGGDPDLNSTQDATGHASQKSVQISDDEAEINQPSTIDRSKVTDCPFP